MDTANGILKNRDMAHAKRKTGRCKKRSTWSAPPDPLYSDGTEPIDDLAFGMPRPSEDGVRQMRAIIERRRGSEVSEGEAAEALRRIMTIVYCFNLIAQRCSDMDSTQGSLTTTKS